MTIQKCDHDFRAYPLPDRTIECRCLHCKAIFTPIKGIADPLIFLEKQYLENKKNNYLTKAAADPKNQNAYQHSLKTIDEQLQILNDWLYGKTADLIQPELITEPTEPEPTEPTEPIAETEPEPTEPTEPIAETEPEPTEPTEPTEPPKPKNRRYAGEGSGEIYYRKSKPRQGKVYDQMFFRVSRWNSGERKWRRSFYVPRRLEETVKELHNSHVPVRVILEKIAPLFEWES